MRILIDLQGAQSGSSRPRGIGRYAVAIAKAIIQNRGDHDILLLLNGSFEEKGNEVRVEFSSILPENGIVVFSVPTPAEGMIPENGWRREAAELIREWTINQIAPDVLLITSMFEGALDNSITSIGGFDTSIKVAVILYDLIPFLDPESYLHNYAAIQWYYSKIDSIKRADLLMAISESARNEAIDALGIDGSQIVTIGSAADERFTAATRSFEEERAFLQRMGIHRKFVLHASAFEPRKNFEGLVRAFALLSKPIRQNYQLVLLASPGIDADVVLRRVAEEAGLGPDELVLPGYVPDTDLVALYSLCTVFVFPSFHEGFGLPALEAMRCGAAVIGSNTTSIPEVIGREDALFDPSSDHSIALLMERALTDASFRESLKVHSLHQSRRFNWNRSAQLAIHAIQMLGVPDQSKPQNRDVSVLLEQLASLNTDVLPTPEDLTAISLCIVQNERAIYESKIGQDGSTGAWNGDAGNEWPRRNEAVIINELKEALTTRLPVGLDDDRIIIEADRIIRQYRLDSNDRREGKGPELAQAPRPLDEMKQMMAHLLRLISVRDAAIMPELQQVRRYVANTDERVRGMSDDIARIVSRPLLDLDAIMDDQRAVTLEMMKEYGNVVELNRSLLNEITQVYVGTTPVDEKSEPPDSLKPNDEYKQST